MSGVWRSATRSRRQLASSGASAGSVSAAARIIGCNRAVESDIVDRYQPACNG